MQRAVIRPLVQTVRATPRLTHSLVSLALRPLSAQPMPRLVSELAPSPTTLNPHAKSFTLGSETSASLNTTFNVMTLRDQLEELGLDNPLNLNRIYRAGSYAQAISDALKYIPEQDLTNPQVNQNLFTSVFNNQKNLSEINTFLNWLYCKHVETHKDTEERTKHWQDIIRLNLDPKTFLEILAKGDLMAKINKVIANVDIPPGDHFESDIQKLLKWMNQVDDKMCDKFIERVNQKPITTVGKLQEAQDRFIAENPERFNRQFDNVF